MCKFCCGLALLLAVLVAGMAYKFIVQGNVTATIDGRPAIELTIDERNVVLSEMRAFLASVQAITTAIVAEDMDAVATSARRVGMAAQVDVPGSLVGKLPLAFKKLGFDTHSRFDQLALDAESLGDPAHALKQLGELMGNCVACHAGYKFITIRDN